MKRKTVVRRRLADEDIDAAIDYYFHEAGADVAARFIANLESVIRQISKHPAIGSPR